MSNTNRDFAPYPCRGPSTYPVKPGYRSFGRGVMPGVSAIALAVALGAAPAAAQQIAGTITGGTGAEGEVLNGNEIIISNPQITGPLQIAGPVIVGTPPVTTVGTPTPSTVPGSKTIEQVGLTTVITTLTTVGHTRTTVTASTGSVTIGPDGNVDLIGVRDITLVEQFDLARIVTLDNDPDSSTYGDVMSIVSGVEVNLVTLPVVVLDAGGGNLTMTGNAEIGGDLTVTGEAFTSGITNIGDIRTAGVVGHDPATGSAGDLTLTGGTGTTTVTLSNS